MPKETISFRAEKKKIKEFDKIAAHFQFDRSKMLNTVINDYISFYNYQIEKIKKGVADADKGNFASEQEVRRMFDKYKLDNKA